MTKKMAPGDLAFDKNHCHLLWIIGKISSAGDLLAFSFGSGVVGIQHFDRQRPHSLIALMSGHR
jgi:hypothetical protein